RDTGSMSAGRTRRLSRRYALLGTPYGLPLPAGLSVVSRVLDATLSRRLPLKRGFAAARLCGATLFGRVPPGDDPWPPGQA
ncbi:MAG TPA: hypothetical protein VN971_00935, partial [Thermoanaerobaculia bacterium]|nr:hypothetical protein [Thermoanaerobaculia bacterium]